MELTVARSARIAKPERKRVERSASYLFRIVQVEPHYSFGANDGRFGDGAYSEYMHHQILGACLSPSKLAGRQTTFTLLGNRGMLDDAPRSGGGIGTLTMRGDRSEYLGSLPYDAAHAVAALILLEGYRFIFLGGDATRYGSARIRYMGFYRTFDFDDL